MYNCEQCGEDLPDPQAECPVCDVLDQSTGETMEEDDLSGSAPALGAKEEKDDQKSAKPTPEAPGSGADSDPAQPNPPSTDDDEYRQKFEQAALRFGTDANIIKRIEMLAAQNVPAALFLGVRTTGKTWLMQRMKAGLREKKYDCRPPLAITDKQQTSADVQQADLKKIREDDKKTIALSAKEALAADERAAAGDTGRSEAIIFHRFFHSSGSFALIDVPGEQIELLAKENYSASRGLLAAMEYASAIIVALPADVVLLGEQYLDEERDEEEDAEYAAFSQDVDRLEEFTDAIGNFAAVRSLIRHEGIDIKWKDPSVPEDEFDLKVTPEAVELHRTDVANCTPIGGHDGMECPAFFALTKADRVFATLDVLPDAASNDNSRRAKFISANKALRESANGEFLTQIYQGSPLNPVNRAPSNDLFSRVMGAIAGRDDPTTEISNPPDLVRSFNRTLFNRLTDYMPMSRFDLIAAFYGNTKKSLQKRDLKRMESVGVSELIDWLGQLHDHGINQWHVWARSVFRRIYGSVEDYGGVFGGAGRYAFKRRLKWVPRPLLAKMFRKEWHPAQQGPIALAIVATIGMFLATFNLLENTDQFADGALYREFETALERGSTGTVAQVPPAIAALPTIPENVDQQAAAQWSPVQGLTGWNVLQPQGTYQVPSAYVGTQDMSLLLPDEAELPEELNMLRLEQINWQERFVCGVDGWGKYAPVIRKAVINGYGECSTTEIFALRSPAIDNYGTSGGLMLLLGWLMVAGLFAYDWWFRKTRSAYRWLYHSNAATTHRRPTSEAE